MAVRWKVQAGIQQVGVATGSHGEPQRVPARLGQPGRLQAVSAVRLRLSRQGCIALGHLDLGALDRLVRGEAVEVKHGRPAPHGDDQLEQVGMRLRPRRARAGRRRRQLVAVARMRPDRSSMEDGGKG